MELSNFLAAAVGHAAAAALQLARQRRCCQVSLPK